MYFNYDTFYLVSAFVPFLAFGPFSKGTEDVARLYLFLVFMSIFCICWFHNRFWHLAHFQNALSHVAPLYFSRFHERPQKSYQSKFQKCCLSKIKKNK